jgi:amidophosphoribosyltransferase
MIETPFDDTLHEECGIFGVFGTSESAKFTALGLHALQHRGQEAAGIVTTDGRQFMQERRRGLVGDKFTRHDVISRLRGSHAIGHVRYATTGGAMNRNIHNGNLTNALTLRQQLIRRGAIFQSTTDTETILHLVATSHQSLPLHERLIEALKEIEGAYSLVALTPNSLIGVRDPLGVRPLILGKRVCTETGKTIHLLASETCALDIIGAEIVRDIDAGEMVICDENGITSLRPFGKTRSRFCVFEYIYFARPDSVVDGRSVYAARKKIGMELSAESPIEADVIVPVPDSGNPAAMGYAQASGIPFELGIIRNHYVGRTFIEPNQQIRDLGVKLKHSGNRNVLEGKRVILIDDSIVRGTTSLKIVEMVREAGAKEVHMRIASPPTKFSCYYGVDTPDRDKLLAAQMDIEAMRQFIKADSLAFLSIDGLYRAMGETMRNKTPQFCDACFTGDYPIKLTDMLSKKQDNSLSLLVEA